MNTVASAQLALLYNILNATEWIPHLETALSVTLRRFCMFFSKLDVNPLFNRQGNLVHSSATYVTVKA